MTYDQWKTTPPWEWGGYDREEPEFFCTECHDTAYEIDERGEAVPCAYCHNPITLDDLEELALEERP